MTYLTASELTPYELWQLEHYGNVLPEYDNPFSDTEAAEDDNRIETEAHRVDAHFETEILNHE